jgi:hypothetical protein
LPEERGQLEDRGSDQEPHDRRTGGVGQDHDLQTPDAHIGDPNHKPADYHLQPFDSPVAKTIATFRDKPLDFQPGEKMSYSNSAISCSAI